MTPTPLGLHSEALARVRALLSKRGRLEQGRFAFEGATLLEEALAGGVEPLEVFATQAGWDSLGPTADRLSCPAHLIPERALGRISDLEQPPGVVTVARRALRPPGSLLADGRAALLLAGVADPGNAGTLLRSAEIFGVNGVLFGEDGVEPYNPKVVRGSMGAIFRLGIAIISPAELATAARQFGYDVVAADRDGVPAAEFAYPERVILAIGNERQGTAGWLPYRDGGVAVPHVGRGESLNAAVAGSIILYEFSRRQRAIPSGLSRRQKP